MVHNSVRIPFAALLAAAAIGQSRSPSASEVPLPLALDEAISHAGAAAPSPSPDLRFDPGWRPQDVDYSPRGMFLQEHGDFMLKYDRFRPDAEFSFAAMPDQEIQGEPGRFDLFYGKGRIDLPIYVSPDAYLIVGAYGSNRHYTVSNMPLFSDENLAGVGVTLGVGAFLDPNVLLEVKVQPGLWSDLDGSLKHQDYDMPGSALINWRMTDDVFVKFGARYNQVYQEAPWLPYLGLTWAIENFRVDIMLPERVELSWWPDSSFGVLFGTQIDGAQYRVRTSAASGRIAGDAQVQEVIVYGGVQSRFSDSLSLTARAGAVVAGDYHLTSGNTSLGFADGTLDAGLFVELSLGLNF